MALKDVTLDVITTEIIRNGLVAITREMNKTLVRTAFNPLLYEIKDFGVGLTDRDGNLWAEAPAVTVFLGCLSDTVKNGLTKFGHDGFAPGDVIIANDPFTTGTHISDTSVYVPIFAGDELVGFAITTAHWADIGGKTPGGWCPDSTDVYQEGMCFTHLKLERAGVPDETLYEFILSNVRFPVVVRGDLSAQLAACRQGRIGLEKLCQKYGANAVARGMKLVAERTASTMRERIRELPDGTYAAESYLDYDGVTKDVSPLIRVSITVAGDALEVDFKGSSPTTRGPVNIPFIGSKSAVRAALKGVLYPRDETNYGHFDAIVCIEYKGLITSPQRPGPTDSYGYAACAIMNLVSRAMHGVVPERCSADAYQLFGCYLYRVDERDGKPFIFIEPIDGGHGARPHHDGPTLIFWADGDTPNMPVEVLETRFPIRCEQSALIHEAGGPGKFRGGAAVRREFRVLEDGIYLQTIIEGTKDPARGLAGGEQAHGGVIIVRPGTQQEEMFQSRLSFYGPLSKNELVRVQSGGGGGLGPPTERDPELVKADLVNGTMTPESAHSVYGFREGD